MFLKLYYQAADAISNASSIVVSGYSFGDKGINNLLIEWLESDFTRRLLVIDPAFDKLQHIVPLPILQRWQSWLDQKRLIPLQASFKNVEWEEIRTKLLDN